MHVTCENDILLLGLGTPLPHFLGSGHMSNGLDLLCFRFATPPPALGSLPGGIATGAVQHAADLEGIHHGLGG